MERSQYFIGSDQEMNLVPVTEIPLRYQSIFHYFPYFNIVQSTVFEDAFYTDKSLMLCAPTGSGKTVVFELCIIRLLMMLSEKNHNLSNIKIVYMAPVKSLCNERYQDWKSKFEPLGVLCIQLTGDTEKDDYFELQKHTLILTTPEKWDSVTRLWKNNKSLVQMVKLLLIDEIHLLNEEERGATLEATLSRMKTIQLVLSCNSTRNTAEFNFRFVAASATFPNVEDAAAWLSTPSMKAVFYRMNENLRPVCLKKVVIGYPYDPKSSEFKFDLMLSYKLNYVIQTYSENKPTLVFCSTRKSVMQTASILSKFSKFILSASHKALMIDAANRTHDSSLRECVLNGIGFHHGGLSVSDRRLLENLFLSCQLLVLVSTSTLSMGVNFPAHLVVIKSTSQYVSGCYNEYSNTQIFQMLGRAGRPQFDRNATAVIMTKSSLQTKYEALVNGNEQIESNLHKHMAEHLNAEIALHSITDVSIAMEWLKATFLYQRVFKNPNYYGMSSDLTKDKIERKLQDLCMKELNGLRKYQLVHIDDDSFCLKPTKTGRLMANFHISYETMKLFCSVTGKENLAEMITLFSSCKEFDEIQLRVNEKKNLNDLNKSKLSSIRFPIQGRIKTKQMKINCLIQATFGCLTISDPSLNQDVARIFQNAIRISKCLVEYLITDEKGFAALHSAVILSKCFKARLWENSKFVSRQLDKIGIAFSNLLVNAGITTIEKILKTNPREIELILKRNPPFGSVVLDSARKIPRYSLLVEQILPFLNSAATISVAVKLENAVDVLEKKETVNSDCYILIGNAENKIILFEKIRNAFFNQDNIWSRKIEVTKSNKNDINIYVISDSFVGVDIYQSYSLVYDSLDAKSKEQVTKKTSAPTYEYNTEQIAEMKKTRDCNHRCINKGTCSHSCCKIGVAIPIQKKTQMSNFMEQLQSKVNNSPKKIKLGFGSFSDNVKIFKVNDCNNATSIPSSMQDLNHDSTYSQLFSKYEKDASQDFLPQHHDKEQIEEFRLNSAEEANLLSVSFDINFSECNSEDNSLSSHQDNKVISAMENNKSGFQIFPQKDPDQSRKIEKWDDPKASEDTLNMCLDHLINIF